MPGDAGDFLQLPGRFADYGLCAERAGGDNTTQELVLRAFTSGVVARPLEPRCSRTIGLAFPKTANSVVSQTMLCYFEDWTGKMAAGETKHP